MARQPCYKSATCGRDPYRRGRRARYTGRTRRSSFAAPDPRAPPPLIDEACHADRSPRAEAQLTEAQLTQALGNISTATLTSVLGKKGLHNVFMRSIRPLSPQQPRAVGRAFTLRFVPAREDLATPAAWASPISTRAAIEAMPAGCIAVVDAMGVTDAGIFGDILCARMKSAASPAWSPTASCATWPACSARDCRCGARAARRRPPSRASPSSTGSSRSAAAALPFSRTTWSWPMATARCVIPAALVEEVVAAAGEQERLEAWILREVTAGASLPGLYPPNAANQARYAADSSGRDGTT